MAQRVAGIISLAWDQARTGTGRCTRDHKASTTGSTVTAAVLRKASRGRHCRLQPACRGRRRRVRLQCAGSWEPPGLDGTDLAGPADSRTNPTGKGAGSRCVGWGQAGLGGAGRGGAGPGEETWQGPGGTRGRLEGAAAVGRERAGLGPPNGLERKMP